MALNPRKYQGWHRGIGDESNSPVLELLLAGELTETYPRALHIAQASAQNTDWNVAANAHPTLYLHSTTTPATDYIRFDHDGTDADIDVVGATNLNLQVAGTTVAQVQANALTLPTDDDFIALGASDDVQLLWSDGDADNHAAVIAIGNTSQQLHITDVGAKATDWNVSAATHPELYIHSNTTPATDYIRIGAHDGTTAYVDVVGGTTLSFQIDGTAEFTLAANVFTALSGSIIDFDAAAGSYATLIRDVNDNEILDTQGVASAVNQAAISNSATGNPVIVEARGGDTNIPILLQSKGTGQVRIPNASEGLRLGTVSTFGTTQPTNAIVMRTGTAPAGAITTAGGLFSDGTVVRKIIADGTASNVEA